MPHNKQFGANESTFGKYLDNTWPTCVDVSSVHACVFDYALTCS